MYEKDKYWIELNICSDLSEKLICTRLEFEEPNLISKRLESIVRRKAWGDLYEKKAPVFLKDMLGQIIQELEIESNPIWIDFVSNEKSDALFVQLKNELSVHPKRRGSLIKKPVLWTKDDFYCELQDKAAISKLAKAIISNENRFGDIVYLFEKQTILKNPFFFDLFQHWFESTSNIGKIDELIYQLKKKADLISTGPRAFTRKEKIGIIYQYIFLKKVFNKIKQIIEEPHSEHEIAREWKKMNAFLEGKGYFDIDNANVRRKVRYQGLSPAEFLPHKWLRRQFGKFIGLAKYDMDDREFREEILICIQEAKNEGKSLYNIRKALQNYLKSQVLQVLINTQPSELSYFMMSVISGHKKRQLRRVIDENRDILQSIEKRFIVISSLA